MCVSVLLLVYSSTDYCYCSLFMRWQGYFSNDEISSIWTIIKDKFFVSFVLLVMFLRDGLCPIHSQIHLLYDQVKLTSATQDVQSIFTSVYIHLQLRYFWCITAFHRQQASFLLRDNYPLQLSTNPCY